MERRSETPNPSYRYAKVLGQMPKSQQLLGLLAILAVIASIFYILIQKRACHDGLLTVNKRFSWEPAYFARLRWITNAQKILDAADYKVCQAHQVHLVWVPLILTSKLIFKAQGRPYRVCRGDTGQIILAPNMIPELNGLGIDVLNSRESHSFSLLGDLTGMAVVRKTSFHVRVLLSYISPALPALFTVTAARISAGIKNEFPQDNEWTVMKPSKAVVRCISEAIALMLFGAEMTADNPELVHLTHEHTNNGEPLEHLARYGTQCFDQGFVVFQVCFAMRCVPEFLQPLLVWLLPAKWGLISGWRKLEGYVVPRVLELKDAKISREKKSTTTVNPDVLSWMVEDGRNEMERDPDVLTTLVGSIAAGSTYSITNFCCRTIMDMVAHPDVLDAVRAEIRKKHVKIHGRWNISALASLEKLESAMKESARLTPGTLLVYSRVVKKDHVLSNGLALKKGQFVTMSGATRTMDPTIFEDPREYKGLRFCSDDRIEEHRARPFSSIDTDILTWGAGRWSCPGRLITDMSAKILLVKLLDEYDFAFVGDKPLKRSIMHEFLFFHPENQMLLRRREESSGIVFL